jgi:hypothetical protein
MREVTHGPVGGLELGRERSLRTRGVIAIKLDATGRDGVPLAHGERLEAQIELHAVEQQRRQGSTDRRRQACYRDLAIDHQERTQTPGLELDADHDIHVRPAVALAQMIAQCGEPLGDAA